MKGPLAVAQKTQAARAESEKRKSTGHVEDHTGPRELLVESEGSIDISNVQGNAGERKVHAFTSRNHATSSAWWANVSTATHDGHTSLPKGHGLLA
jgi:hypothetical protein